MDTAMDDSTKADAPNELFDRFKEEAQVCLEQGDLRGARQSIEGAASLTRSSYEAHVVGALLSNLGLRVTAAAHLLEAREVTTEAVKWLERAEAPADLAQACINAGVAEREIGDLTAALAQFQRALDISTLLEDEAGMGQALMELGLTRKDQVALTEARSHLEQALKQLPEEAVRPRANTHAGLGLLWERLRDRKRAAEHYDKARALYRAVEDRENEAVVVLNLGELANGTKRFEDALRHYEEALTLTKKSGAHLVRIDALNALGSVALAMEERARAQALRQEALDLARMAGYRRGQTDALVDLAILKRDEGEAAQAEGLLGEALAVAERMGALSEVFEIYVHRGDVRHQAGRWAEAAADYARAAEMQDSIRGQIQREREALNYFGGEQLNVYDRLVDLHGFRFGDLAKAFEWAEAAKAREFLRRFRLSSLVRPHGVRDELVRREAELLARLREADAVLATAADGVAASTTVSDLTIWEELNEELQQVWDEIGINDPEYASLRRGRPASLEELKAALLARQSEPAADERERERTVGSIDERRVVLITYYLTRDVTFVFGLWDGLDVPEVAVVPIGRGEVRRFARSNFGQHDAVRELIVDFEELWHSYDALVEPVSRWAAPGDILCLVPHDALHYMPLHALKVEDAYLIERNPVFYVPSASTFRYGRLKRKLSTANEIPDRKVLIIGDSRSDLPAARSEAEALARSFGVKPLLGTDVVRERLGREFQEADLVHFAGHAHFSPYNPFESGLSLAGGDVLTMGDVIGMKLRADLVTLSGCETGVSDQRPGDELIGLTRSFLYAGPSSLLVSLWRVSDASSAYLMERFYTYLRAERPLSKAEALRRAMLDVRAKPEWTPFFHWAPFVLVGDWV